MKNYTITVNGTAYEVTVEEKEDESVNPSSDYSAAKTAGSARPAAKAPEKASGVVGSIKVSAPMPGKVLSISAKPGQNVKKGETILVFEAMKMENSVVAPQDGIVVSINVAVGDSFEAGAAIAFMD